MELGYFEDALKGLKVLETKLLYHCVKQLLRDRSPIELATLCTDELEMYLISYAEDDDMLSNREMFTLMHYANKAENRLYDALGVRKNER